MADAFWTFSLAFYGRSGVAAACIALQDEFGADVNLMLFGLWTATLGRSLDDPTLDRLERSCAAWRTTVITPLRAARRALSPPPPGMPFDPALTNALRRKLLAAELDAEHLQQSAMETLAPGSGAESPQMAGITTTNRLAARYAIPLGHPALIHLLEQLA